MSYSPGNDDPALIDRSALTEISGGDQAVERELLMVFRQTSAADAAALKQALEQHDIAAVTRMSHRIKGASRIVGAVVLADICASIEQAAGACDWNTIAANRDALDRELDRVNAYLGTLQTTRGP